MLPGNLNELWARFKKLLQKNWTGKNSILFTEEIIAIADKLLEYKCISKKQHRFLIIEI